MKKIFTLSLLIVSIFTSCENDLLEPFTPGSLTEEVAFTSSSDLQRLMNSTYGSLAERTDVVFTSVFTDEVGIGFGNGGQGINDDYVFFLDVASTSPNLIWVGSYGCLARVNRVITFADKLIAKNAGNNAEIIKLNQLKGEALTLRALVHLKIMAYFSPDLKNDAALAGVLADKIVSSSDAPLSRSTNGQFYTLIHKDLDQALAIFRANATPFSGAAIKLYAGTNLAKAIKARAFAYKGDYTNAAIWADDVISTSGLVLANTNNYTSVFWTDSEPTNTEVIFRLKRTLQQSSQATNLGNGYASVNSTLSGSPFYEISRALYNRLVSVTSDVRTTTMVHSTSKIDPNYASSTDYRNTDVLVLTKHPGGTSVGNLNSDFKIVRLSEMYFIKAEAQVAAGDLTAAAATIKVILDNRYTAVQPLPSYANATEAWKGILDQRRLEFAFEGYRFIDLKRIGTLAGATLDRHPADYNSSSANYPGGNPDNLPLTSTKFALPIPQVELNANPSIQQNQGY